ncbi:MAG: hypothetical protein HC888_04005 [Candidatus Competibacteraceae bacterium]|nr:hypothetical protein [Candidatus Competibacteraceae bacterium]
MLLIPHSDYRMMCWWAKANSVAQLKSSHYSEIPMIALILMQAEHRFMKGKGYSFAGEISFDQQGNPVPVTPHTWTVKGEEHIFTRAGYLFFEHESGNSEKNVVIYNYSDFARGSAGIVVYAKDDQIAKKYINELEEYAKTDNCLRGAKMRDINMMNATFVEVKQTRVYSWDTFYYPERVRSMFELEVFGFLENAERYNARGITKRGIMMHGPPGCVTAETKIRIRQKSDDGFHPSYKE